MISERERFWSKVDKAAPNGCWVWTRGISFGYGRFTLRPNRWVKAHRYSYETLIGPVPEGLCLDHLCRNRACVNPDHLEAVTMKTNLNRGRHWLREKTHCKRGHEFTPENILSRPGPRRICRECNRIRCRQAYAEGRWSNRRHK